MSNEALRKTHDERTLAEALWELGRVLETILYSAHVLNDDNVKELEWAKDRLEEITNSVYDGTNTPPEDPPF